eukprot:c28132_g1_i2 orf=603-2333(-)
MQRLNDRLEQATSDCLEWDKTCRELQEKLENSKAEIAIYEKVVDKFWRLREKVTGINDGHQSLDRASILLQDLEISWRYGDTNEILEGSCVRTEKAEAALVIAQEELHASIASARSFQKMLEEETASRRKAEDQALHYKQCMSHFAEAFGDGIQRARSTASSIKGNIVAILDEERNWVHSILETWQYFWKDARIAPSEPVDKYEEGRSQVKTGIENELKGIEELYNMKEASCSITSTEVEELMSQGQEVSRGILVDGSRKILDDLVLETDSVDGQRLTDDNKEALAQALTEKVAALLLLSQQEERHILEKNVAFALECQITELKQQLLQVTGEKVNALMELANLRHEYRELQDHERDLNQMLRQYHGTSASGRLLPANWADIQSRENEKGIASFENDIGKKAASKGYLRSWLRGLYIPVSISSTPDHIHGVKNKTFKNEDEAVAFAGLRVENAALHENLSSIQHLSHSAKRLRLIIRKASIEQNREAAIQAVDSVATEAQRLKVPFCSSLPVSYSGNNIIESPTTRPSGIEDAGVEAKETLDVVSVFGMEIVELILLAAELQKAELMRKLNTVQLV